MTKRGVGCNCKCGASIWLWDTEMQTDEELAELREWKKEDDWTRVVFHSPNGCGHRMVVNPEDLVLLERRSTEAVPRHQHVRPI